MHHRGLEGKQHQEGDHQAEQTHRFGQGEPEDGVGKHLLLEGGIPGVPVDERGEDRSNTNT